MNSYILVNPHIEGSIDTKFKTKSANEAATLAYDTVSKYFSNNLPKFSFTLQKAGSDKFYHFDVNEKINKNDKIKFQIKEKTNVTNIDGLIKFIETNNTTDLAGGRSHRSHRSHKYGKYRYDDEDSSDSSDSDDDYYYYYRPVTRNMPITYWSYYPYAYNLKQIYVPTFVPSISPYVYINFSN
jgi:hypothetical protein